MARIESMLSARLFLVPQLVGDQIFFVSNMSGHLSLYSMDIGGSVPQPLLPPDVVLQNPHLLENLYYVFPKLGKILIMLDDNGDENYQPMLIPMEGGDPEVMFGGHFAPYRVQLVYVDVERNLAYLVEESREESLNVTYQADLASQELLEMERSKWGKFPFAVNEQHDKAILAEGYTAGDVVLFSWEKGTDGSQSLYGTPLEDRSEGEQV